jgi:hypothetical protein
MKLIPLKGKYGEGKFTKVSDEDYEFACSLSLYVNDGYVKTYYKGRHWKLHQLLVGSHYDHINNDRLDNQRENLRKSTQQQNNCNVKTRSKSGYKGVYQDGIEDSYRAEISIDGKMHALGTFPKPRWAGMAYILSATAVNGEFASHDFTPDELVAMFLHE